jgi:chemotaxis methyl-accepting protein methylase
MDNKRINEIINWDVETWKEALPYWEDKLLDYDKTSALCIEIGARDGSISLWMATNGFNITCSDIYYDLEEAKKLHLKYGISKNVVYKKIDVLDWNEKNKYDVIIIKSVLGALQNEKMIEIAIKNIYENLKEGGILLFAENSKATIFHQQFRKRFTNWGNILFYFDEKSVKMLLKKMKVIEVKYNGVLAVFGNRIGFSKPFSNLDKFILNKIASNKIKYMLFGYAKK